MTKKQSKRKEIKKYKRQVAKIFASECYVCGKRYGKNFHFNHYLVKQLKRFKTERLEILFDVTGRSTP